MQGRVTDDPVLRRFRAELDRVYGDRIERVVLFGSRARGDHREDSDYDVAVFLRDQQDWFAESMRLGTITMEIAADTGAYVSAKSFSPEAYDSPSGFMTSVRRDAISL